MELTRGGRKLEAAVERFGLADRIRGARAVDVGASTGGFVAVLLQCGAARVTAVDVGHGQLEAALAADRRVENLEKTDWKTLSLNAAPGPFDFFTVDVSFVAARNMLRGLAFRLRDQAQGVVLVKPQFELPTHLVQGGRVDAPGLRERALATFRKKAESLGFRILAHMDSPVAGGSGTVEILAHLEFTGRPSSMPRPGEKRPVRAPSGKSRARQAPGTLSWFAAATPGLEETTRNEVAKLPLASQVRAVAGGVEFTGPLQTGMAANLHLRVASRVLVRMGKVKARDFAPLRRRLADLPWDQFVPTDRPVRIDASATRCRLYHTGALAETLGLALADRLGPLPERRPSEAAEPADDEEDERLTRILLRGVDDEFTASVDSSGALLHRRGWRLEAGPAPLRETLAAGLLGLCGYDSACPFLDPMCGSGTITIEACAMAMRLAPGLARRFAFEQWPCLDQETWARLCADATSMRLGTLAAPVEGSDRDPRIIEIAARNAERAGFSEKAVFRVAEFSTAPHPAPAGLLIINPPYGKRLGHPGEAVRLGRAIGRTLLANYRGWRAGVVAANRSFAQAVASALRMPPNASHALRNGGLRISLLIWDSIG